MSETTERIYDVNNIQSRIILQFKAFTIFCLAGGKVRKAFWMGFVGKLRLWGGLNWFCGKIEVVEDSIEAFDLNLEL
jgi:hypothetical protein